MAIEILKRERAKLREKAKSCNRRHRDANGAVSVRTWNLLRRCASLTVAILALKHMGLA